MNGSVVLLGTLIDVDVRRLNLDVGHWRLYTVRKTAAPLWRKVWLAAFYLIQVKHVSSGTGDFYVDSVCGIFGNISGERSRRDNSRLQGL